MTADRYQALALLMRFAFSGLGLAIIAFAVRTYIADSRNARLLRDRQDEAGFTALLILQGRKETKLPLMREGDAGSGRGCDLVIKSCGLEKRHFYYELGRGELRLYPADGEVRRQGKPRPGDETVLRLRGGESFCAGKGVFRLVLLKPYAEPVSPLNKYTRRPEKQNARGDR